MTDAKRLSSLSRKRPHGGDESPASAKRLDLGSAGEDKDLGTMRAVPDGQDSNKAWKMMARFGYEKGTGLGSQKQGRVEPVALSTQRGRRGLGLNIKGLEPDSNLQWDDSKDEISVEEEVVWMPPCTSTLPGEDELSSWMRFGPKKLTIDDETEFCSEHYLTEMLAAKSIFDQLGERELRNARTRANPFESIRGVFFQNRAAMKMANLDKVLDFLLTSPKHLDNSLMVQPENADDLFYFADICAGPGGFTEYVLWRLAGNAHGFGFTLRGKDDFKLDKFYPSPEMFEPFYGKSGLEGDGDIMNPDNLESFRKFVLDCTDQKGVHLVMADGGFSVEGQENLQEILSKRLYLCQFACAVSILREGGNFVCKLFDIFTSFSVGLVYLLYHAFESIAILKPNTSRPANSERYIIGKRLKSNVEPLVKYLFTINRKLDELSKNQADRDVADVIAVVPDHVLQTDEDFLQYVIKSNELFAVRQTSFLRKYKIYAQNNQLHDGRQDALREDCLAYWEIPDLPRREPPKAAPMNALVNITKNNIGWLSAKPDLVASELADLEGRLEKPLEYRYVLSTAEPVLILALGKTFIFYWDGSRFDLRSEIKVLLPENTFLLTEIGKEYRGEGRGQLATTVIRILDAYMLNGVDVSEKLYEHRLRLARKFCRAISHEKSRPDLARVCVADVWKADDVADRCSRLRRVVVKGAEKIGYYADNEHYWPVRGMHLVKAVKLPWTIAWSKSRHMSYYFNTKTGQSTYELPEDPEGAENFVATFTQRIFWNWQRADPAHFFEKADLLMDNALTLDKVTGFFAKVRVPPPAQQAPSAS